MAFDQREYQTVVLAALLHDIGKFMNRADNVRRKHPLFSADYVSHEEFKKHVKKEWVNLDLLKTLVQRHHEHPLFPDELKVQAITDKSQRALAYIVSRADSYSSSERIGEAPSELNFRDARLRSVPTRVDIDKGDPQARYYRLGRLSPEIIFPLPEDEMAQETYDYEKLQSEFGKAFVCLKPEGFDAVFNGLLSLLHEFLWCVPSDTRDRYNDVSLYDHLSTTSAIAACLYHYHAYNLDEQLIIDDTVDKFILVAGDLSGIQKFIFEIGSTNPKKLSKILRGRSFYLSLLPEITSYKILRRLSLPISCRIMNAGGRFVLLLPNTEKAKQTLTDLRSEIDEWFYERFLGKLSLNLAWGITLSGKCFGPQEFSKKYMVLSGLVELAKKKKFTDIIRAGDEKLRPAMQKAHQSLQANGEPCEFCKVYPKDQENRCRICLDSEFIGRQITSQGKYLYFYEGVDRGDIELLGYSLSFDSKGSDWLLLEYFGEENNLHNPGYIKRWVSNYVPIKEAGDIELREEPQDEASLCYQCKDRCQLEEDRAEGVPGRQELTTQTLTFQCLAASAVRLNKGKGVDHLAVLKADVDDLGAAFSIGLGDMFSISRYSGLSRMLDYFFVGWLKDALKNDDDYRMAYTVYAGGDDLLIIAPWETALQLAGEIGANFRAYVGDNPNLTISMGINLMRPDTPVKIATKGAEGLLEKSKSCEEKNRLTVFGTTIEWGYLPALEKFKDMLDTGLNTEDTGINTSFLYRLLKYHEMCLAASEGVIEGLKFHSAMARDIRRNIESRKNGSVYAEKFLPLYMVGDGFDQKLMKHLKMPVFWALYKNRGGGR